MCREIISVCCENNRKRTYTVRQVEATKSDSNFCFSDPDNQNSIGSDEGSQNSYTWLYNKGIFKIKMSVEQWWNDTDRRKLKYWERNIIQRVW